jgi:toxin ParE1/3/4
MTRFIRWSVESLHDLAEILDYITPLNEYAAEMLQDRIENSVLPLAAYPYLGREGRVEGTRELVAHPNYVAVYRVEDDTVVIRNVLHVRRNYP